MPKRKNTGKRSRSYRNSGADDITVYDYAHIKRANGSDRPRKAQLNEHQLQEAKRELSVCPGRALDALDWDERSIDSYEFEFDSLTTQKPEATASNARKSLKPLSQSTGAGARYPLDLWFHVARFIRPEDVSRFALICRDTHLITHTAHFWVKLYERIHKTYPSKLPDDLKFLVVERIHGLRAKVIRSIHHAYPLYQPVQPQPTFSDNLYRLETTSCISAWSVKETTRLWYLFFKFRKTKPKCALSYSAHETTSFEGYHLLKGFSDLHFNPNEGCYLLRIATGSYTCVSAAMGLTLISIGVSVSRCMRHHKLKLVLDSRSYIKKATQESTVITVDPALTAKCYAWWECDYHSLTS